MFEAYYANLRIICDACEGLPPDALPNVSKHLIEANNRCLDVLVLMLTLSPLPEEIVDDIIDGINNGNAN